MDAVVVQVDDRRMVERGALYLWTADRSRVYVLVADDTSSGGSFIVVTTLNGVSQAA